MGYNKIYIHGGQVCDYLYVQKDSVDKTKFEYVDSEPSEWGFNTVMFAKFNGDLLAGNSSLQSNIDGYEVRRRRGASPVTEYVATIRDTKKQYLVDYAATNKTEYSYYLYPSAEIDNEGIILSPSITEEITTEWNYWSLLVVDETETDNVFYLNKLFKFELNLTPGDLSNNAVVSVIQNFTKYPTIQYGTSNYWSGTLSALCGFITCDDTEYVQTANMIEELKALTTDTRRKFLKNTDGNLWEVKITAPINISSVATSAQDIKTVQLSWTEVASAEGVSIINNPDFPNTSWLLTETGEVMPYTEYIWDENYRWDNSYRWTAKDDMLTPVRTNMGRNLNSEEGDG